jgi:hypothetical protein
MTGCGIRARGAKRMGEMLEKNTSLKTLDLGGEIPFSSYPLPFHFDPICLAADVHSRERDG